MNITKTQGATTTAHVPCLLEEATHFEYKQETYPLHQIVDRVTAATKDLSRWLSSHGKEHPIMQCIPLKAVKTTTEDSYDIKLSKGEAEVLAEVLRQTRIGAQPHKDVEAVCGTLWSALPTHSVSNATIVTGGVLHVSKSA